MPEISKITEIPKQTHLNRVPLGNDIIQAPHPCKRQMILDSPDIGYLAGFCVQTTTPKGQCSDTPSSHIKKGRKIFIINVRHKGRRHRKVIGDDTNMSEDMARRLAAAAIAGLKTNQTSRLILPTEMEFSAFATEFFTRYQHNFLHRDANYAPLVSMIEKWQIGCRSNWAMHLRMS